MECWPDHAEQVVTVAGGGKSLSVLAAPQDERTDASYRLSDDARKMLEAVLAEDIGASDRADRLI